MRYRLLGRGTGLRVSEIALGSAVFGTAWGYGAEPVEARGVLADYLAAGGNFIDTADFYQAGQAETIIGEALANDRDAVVLASKYSLGAQDPPSVLSTGNSRLSMIRAVEASLKRLKTDRIDLYWVHMADGVTDVDEIMQGLEDLTRAGKIVYSGFSDFPAWRVARAVTLAELRGWRRPVSIQIEHSLVERAGDRELLPMADALGLGVTAWSPLGGGLLSGKYRGGEVGRATTFGAVVHHEDSARKTAAVDALLAVAGEIGAAPSQVALAWLMANGVIPIIGPRTRQQLADNLGARDLTLSAEQISRLDQTSAIPLEFPHDFLAHPAQADRLAGGAPDRVHRLATPAA